MAEQQPAPETGSAPPPAHHEPNAFHHVQDTGDLHTVKDPVTGAEKSVFENVWEFTDSIFGGIHWELPHFELFGHHFALTKFMILELVAALLILVIFVPLARRMREGGLPTGKWWNLWESILLFVRDEIVRPNLDKADDHAHGHVEHGHAEPAHAHHDHGHGHGHAEEKHDNPHWQSDKFLPFFWTIFLFVLFLNLLGMLPFMGSPTASIWVTGALAAIVFCLIHGSAVAKLGGKGYLMSLWPTIDVPYIGPVISFGIWAIELFGTVIKCGVLAVRLFANMFGGHMVLATILVFIYSAGKLMVNEQGEVQGGGVAIWSVVTLSSVLGQVALSLLELFVAFLQAYVFTYLTAIFMGMALNPEH